MSIFDTWERGDPYERYVGRWSRLVALEFVSWLALGSGSAEDLPLESASIDVAVSGLVLNFVPDLASALRELRRVTVPGGTIGAYVWDYAEGMQLIRHFWDAAVELDRTAEKLDEGVRFPLCSPKALSSAFAEAGLICVATSAVVVPTPFKDLADYWSPFLGGQGPAPAYAMSLSEDRRAQLRARVAERLPRGRDGSIPLVARAWAVRASVPGDI